MAMGQNSSVDCLIVGGGAAGLTAATYLGRYRRSVAVIDAGGTRLARIPISHNIPGFPDGIRGPDLLLRLQDQADRYGVRRHSGVVTTIVKRDAAFEVETTVGSFTARQILLATGVQVADPDIADLSEAVLAGAVRYCPVCDGFEAIGSRVAVLGGRPGSIEEARFLRTYIDDLIFVGMDEAAVLTPEERALALAEGIQIEDRPVTRLARAGSGVQIAFASGAALYVDVVYPCLGTQPRSELAKQLGARVSSYGEILTDKHLQTGVPGVYAAGDVLRGLDQVASACGQAAIAATAIHNALRAMSSGSDAALNAVQHPADDDGSDATLR